MRKQLQRAPRYGNYNVTRRWATPVLLQPLNEASSERRKSSPERWQTLWAERPLQLPEGRALAVRRRGEELEVAVLSRITPGLRWEPLAKVLTTKQTKAWAGSGAFRRT